MTFATPWTTFVRPSQSGWLVIIQATERFFINFSAATLTCGAFLSQYGWKRREHWWSTKQQLAEGQYCVPFWRNMIGWYDMIWYDMIMLLGINPTETGSIRIHRMREWWMATSWMKAHHWIYQLQLFTGLLNTLGKINQSNARRERNVGRSIHWRKDNDWVRIWGVGAPKENAREINLAIVVSK